MDSSRPWCLFHSAHGPALSSQAGAWPCDLTFNSRKDFRPTPQHAFSSGLFSANHLSTGWFRNSYQRRV